MTRPSPVKIGTRKSELALYQANLVKAQLESLGFGCELVLLSSYGDENNKKPLYEVAKLAPGVFTKALEEALLNNQIDIAVHSLKDLATQLPEGLRLGAVTVRESVKDCLLIHPRAYSPKEPLGIKSGATIGSSSLRRESQLISVDNKFRIKSLRGNVPTRVRKAEEGEFDAVCLAEAGLDRLKLSLEKVRKVTLPFPSCPGQGALAIEIRQDTPIDLSNAISTLADEVATRETGLERRLLRELEGGCSLPFAATAKWDQLSGNFHLRASLGVGEHLHWKGYYHFDISDTNEETCFSKALMHFKSVLK